LMRILIATSSRKIVGGLETYLQILIPALLKRKHAVAMVYDYFSNSGEPTVDPSEVELPRWRSADLAPGTNSWRDLAAWNPDVVYSHGLESIEAEQHLLDHYPTVLYSHTYRGTCISGQKCHTFPRVNPCSRKLGPMCLVLFYPRRCGGLNPVVAWNAYAKQKAFNAHFPAHRAVLVASRHMRDELQRHGVSSDVLHLTPLPVAGTDELIVPPRRMPGGRLLFVGRLFDVKGARFLIEAIPKAAQRLGFSLTLTIAGDGPERRSLEDLAQRCHVDVEFPGWVDASQRQELMSQADLLVVPSLWPEPFGLVGVEAGCLGLPSVAYAVGGIPDWLIAGVTGEIAPGDPPGVDGLAEAIVRALADPEHYQNLSLGAWKMAKQFTMERHLAQLETILAAKQPAREYLFPAQSAR
jgi:glycosyltransferase involved in cell wall biosynthesis